MDITGARVEQYVKMVSIAHRLNIFRQLIPFWCERFHFKNDHHYQSMVQLSVGDILMPLILKANPTRLSGCLVQVGDNFQRNSTKVWRNGGKIPEARALLPPVSLHKEISKRGAVKNIKVMILLQGIIVPQSSEGAAGNLCEFKLADDYKSKWLVLVRDGLTQIRIKSFIDEIKKSCYGF